MKKQWEDHSPLHQVVLSLCILGGKSMKETLDLYPWNWLFDGWGVLENLFFKACSHSVWVLLWPSFDGFHVTIMTCSNLPHPRPANILFINFISKKTQTWYCSCELTQSSKIDLLFFYSFFLLFKISHISRVWYIWLASCFNFDVGIRFTY